MMSSIMVARRVAKVTLETKSAILPVNQQMALFPSSYWNRCNGVTTDPMVKSDLIFVKKEKKNSGKNESLKRLDVVKSIKKTQITGTENRNSGSFQQLTNSAARPGHLPCHSAGDCGSNPMREVVTQLLWRFLHCLEDCGPPHPYAVSLGQKVIPEIFQWLVKALLPLLQLSHCKLPSDRYFIKRKRKNTFQSKANLSVLCEVSTSSMENEKLKPTLPH